MDFCRLISRLLAVFAIVGLIVSPLTTPAAAKLLSAAEMSDMSTMSADMPCCPDTQKSNDCKDCPLRAMCTLNVAQAEPPMAVGVVTPLQTRKLFSAFDDRIADGFDRPPPDQPPRT
ncbi:hypothetical protein HMPREF9695_02439 [Afipia broomeae ATCC 49717]|uniref:Uncharacterized protein n=1 Tax=Afipia broomeae ATCC 49717 TaxID=883078 RepID=K8PCY1_9BRAD|nr:hypothetical protein HMPREF9695_02439 [Afipia broomeae ATCC 49717]